ncbi:29181_t:CDS:2, partial [Racocetra persica]
TAAYQELVTIISNNQFNRLDMPQNIHTLRQYRLRLPSLPIRQHEVLKNPALFSKMYFGPRVESKNRTEFWHGTIWSESPLFSDDTLNITTP